MGIEIFAIFTPPCQEEISKYPTKKSLSGLIFLCQAEGSQVWFSGQEVIIGHTSLQVVLPIALGASNRKEKSVLFQKFMLRLGFRI